MNAVDTCLEEVGPLPLDSQNPPGKMIDDCEPLFPQASNELQRSRFLHFGLLAGTFSMTAMVVPMDAEDAWEVVSRGQYWLGVLDGADYQAYCDVTDFKTQRARKNAHAWLDKSEKEGVKRAIYNAWLDMRDRVTTPHLSDTQFSNALFEIHKSVLQSPRTICNWVSQWRKGLRPATWTPQYRNRITTLEQ